jgi:hypothetical protein
MTGNLVFNVDLGNYSFALGAAQRLSNGNYSFTSGIPAPNFQGQSIEVRPDGTKAYVLEINTSLYRSFRVRTLYEGINDRLDNGGGGSGSAAGSGVSAPPVAFADAFWTAVVTAPAASSARPASATTPSITAPPRTALAPARAKPLDRSSASANAEAVRQAPPQSKRDEFDAAGGDSEPWVNLFGTEPAA